MKLIKHWTSGQVELFDLARDLSEERNLAAERPVETAALLRLVEAFVSEVGAETRQLGKAKDD